MPNTASHQKWSALAQYTVWGVRDKQLWKSIPIVDIVGKSLNFIAIDMHK